MGRPKLKAGTTGRVDMDVRDGMTRARARLALPDYSNPITVETATGQTTTYETGRTVQVEARGTTGDEAAARLKAVCDERLRAHRAVFYGTTEGDDLDQILRGPVYAAAVAVLAEDKDLAAATSILYRRMLDNHVKGTPLGRLPVAEVTTGVVARHLRTLTTSHGTATAKLCRAALSKLFARAMLASVVDNNLALGTAVKGGVTVRGARTKVNLDVRRVDLAWEVARRGHPTYRDMVLLNLAVGARLGEVLALRWCDITFTADGFALVDINGTVESLPGRGIVRHAPKTRMSVRLIPVARRVAALLRRRAAAAEVDLGAMTEDERPVFASLNGTFLDRSNAVKRLRHLFDVSGFEGLTFHGLRRDAITRIADNMQIREAADLAGHASISTTQDRYVARGAVSMDITRYL